MIGCLQEVEGIRQSQISKLKPNPVLGVADPVAVSAWTSVDTHYTLVKVHKRLRRLKASTEHVIGGAFQAAADSAVGGYGWRQQLAEYRARLLRVVKATYGGHSLPHALYIPIQQMVSV